MKQKDLNTINHKVLYIITMRQKYLNTIKLKILNRITMKQKNFSLFITLLKILDC